MVLKRPELYVPVDIVAADAGVGTPTEHRPNLRNKEVVASEEVVLFRSTKDDTVERRRRRNRQVFGVLAQGHSLQA